MSPLTPGELALLARFLRRLEAAAPMGAVSRVRVFGSRARGRSGEASDLDVAVLAAPGNDRRRLQRSADDAAWDAMEESDAFALRLSPVVLAEDDRTGALRAAIEREGIPVWPPT